MSIHETTTSTPLLDLGDGRQIPQLGFGVFQVSPEETRQAVAEALQTGYRLIDTAAAYGNEAEVGEAIAASGLPRGELFVTTKLWNDDQGHANALSAFDHSIERLGLEYVDLYLIHWPAPSRGRYLETWKALCELRADGRARSIGVSNFTIQNLEEIIAATDEVPAVNQVELHPRLIQSELRAFHREHGIVTEAWSPLGRGGDLLEESALKEIAAQHGRTPAQVVLRWHIQIGNVAIPRSVTPSRIEENFQLFDFTLSDDEVRAIDALDTGTRIGPDPATFG
ncbi:MAG TPA: aldo/keto reductase [Solirubrobacteraceae bacterium]|jgi:2,5-diketo-D-gluconate reductase A